MDVLKSTEVLVYKADLRQVWRDTWLLAETIQGPPSDDVMYWQQDTLSFPSHNLKSLG